MSAAPLTLPTTSPISNFESSPPAPDQSGDQSPAPFADLMNAALARPGDAQDDAGKSATDSAPTRKSQDGGKETKAAPAGKETASDTNSSTTTAPVSKGDPAQNDPNATNNTLAAAAAALMQPVVVITPLVVPVPVAPSANGGQAGPVTVTKGQADQAVNTLAVPTQTVVTPSVDAGAVALSTTLSKEAVVSSGKPSPQPSATKTADANQPARDLKLPASASPTAAAAISESSQDLAQNGSESGGSPQKNLPEIAVQDVPAGRTNGALTTLGDANGISAAQHALPMNKMAEMSKSTGLTEQNLPVNAVSIAGEDLPVVEKRTLSARSDRTDATALGTATANSRISLPDVAAPTATAATATVSAPATVERTVQMIAQSAIQLRDVTPDSLQVVIKPGGNMQLSLDLHQRDGVVEVQATLQNGDFNFLKQHWSELQQQLEARGVRLLSLATEGQANTDSNQSQKQPPANPDADAKPIRGPGGLAFNSVLSAPVSNPSTTRPGRGWESWA